MQERSALANAKIEVRQIRTNVAETIVEDKDVEHAVKVEK